MCPLHLVLGSEASSKLPCCAHFPVNATTFAASEFDIHDEFASSNMIICLGKASAETCDQRVRFTEQSQGHEPPLALPPPQRHQVRVALQVRVPAHTVLHRFRLHPGGAASRNDAQATDLTLAGAIFRISYHVMQRTLG